MPSVFARYTSRSDPSGLGRVELAQKKRALLEFSQSRLNQPCFFGQFQLSFPAKPRRIPRSSGNARLNPKGIPTRP